MREFTENKKVVFVLRGLRGFPRLRGESRGCGLV
jgi:hypothetical protein